MSLRKEKMTLNLDDAPSSEAPLIPEARHPDIERPCFRVYDHPQTTNDGKKLRAGVYLHGLRHGNSSADPVPFDQWICSPLHIEAVTSCNSADFGRLLRFRNTLGDWREWAMPMHLLKGNGEDLRGELLNMGLEIDPDASKSLNRYLQDQRPKRQVIAAASTGWHSPTLFIMPRQNIGQGDAIYQNEAANLDDFHQGGTLESWQDEIGTRCAGNPLLLLSVCVSLSGPLLFHLNRQGGGFHLVGDSSTGKSSVAMAACSVWGHGEHFKRTWRATGNGLEGIAAQRSDTLLTLDEIGEADPREIGAVIYALANGTGKARAARSGAARAPRRWRVMLLSTGELNLSALMAEAGKRSRAGQEIRLLDISARRTFGAWDDLHGLPGGREFSDAIQRTSVTNYGHAGPTFIRHLIDSGKAESLSDELARMSSHFPTSNGQECRAAERFALVALAGELAIACGLLPLTPGSARDASLALFDSWRGLRGEGPSEERQILKSISDFISRHGDSRFSDADDPNGEARDRAGYWTKTKTGRLYLFNRPGLEEAAKGYDMARVLVALEATDALAKREQGRAQASKRLPNGTKPKLYWIDPDKLESESHANSVVPAGDNGDTGGNQLPPSFQLPSLEKLQCGQRGHYAQERQSLSPLPPPSKRQRGQPAPSQLLAAPTAPTGIVKDKFGGYV